jgi:hypothetical protein
MWCGELRTIQEDCVIKITISLVINIVNKVFGDPSGGGTPGHISNPEVKSTSADGTWGAAPWESRSLPKTFSI